MSVVALHLTDCAAETCYPVSKKKEEEGLGVHFVHLLFSVLGPWLIGVCSSPVHAVIVPLSPYVTFHAVSGQDQVLQGTGDIREAGRRQSPKPTSSAL